MKWWERVPVLALLGIYFLCIGFFHLVGSIGVWHFGGSIAWLTLAYCLLNLLLAYGLLTKQAWVEQALLLNVAGYAFLLCIALLHGSDIDLGRRLIGIAVSGAFWALVHARRHSLAKPLLGGAGIPFLILWTILYVIAFVRVLG